MWWQWLRSGSLRSPALRHCHHTQILGAWLAPVSLIKLVFWSRQRGPPHPKLREISFAEVEDLASVLGQLVECHNIESISLNLTDADDELIMVIPRFSHLKKLTIRSKIASQSLQHRLQEALPGTEITWGR